MKNLLIAVLLSISAVLSAQNSAIQNAMRSFDFDLAIQLINKEKKSSELDFLKAKCYKQLAQYKLATQLLEDLVHQDKLNGAAMNELADCYQLAGNFSKSKFFYFMALQSAPENRFCQMNYLSILYKLKEWKTSISLAHTMLKKDSLTALLPILGDCYAQMAKKDSAIYFYKKGMAANAEDYNTLSKLGKLYWQDGNYADLVRSTNRYIQTDSSNQQINQLNGIGQCLSKNYDSAIYRLNNLAEQNDSSFLTSFYLGASYFATNDYVEAYEHLTQAYQKDSTNQNTFFFLGKSAIMSGHQKEGIRMLTKGISNMTPNDSILFNYNYAISAGYNGLRNSLEEANYLRICYKYMPENKTLLYKIASIYDWQIKNVEIALNFYQQFMSTRPKSPTDSAKSSANLSYYNVVENRIKEIKLEQELKNKKR